MERYETGTEQKSGTQRFFIIQPQPPTCSIPFHLFPSFPFCFRSCSKPLHTFFIYSQVFYNKVFFTLKIGLITHIFFDYSIMIDYKNIIIVNFFINIVKICKVRL